MMVYSDGVTGNGGMERQTDRQTDRQGHRERQRERDGCDRTCIRTVQQAMPCIRTVWQANAVYFDGVAG